MGLLDDKGIEKLRQFIKKSYFTLSTTGQRTASTRNRPGHRPGDLTEEQEDALRTQNLIQDLHNEPGDREDDGDNDDIDEGGVAQPAQATLPGRRGRVARGTAQNPLTPAARGRGGSQNNTVAPPARGRGGSQPRTPASRGRGVVRQRSPSPVPGTSSGRSGVGRLPRIWAASGNRRGR